MLSDNGACYRSHLWAAACTEVGITHKRTRPYRPQTNGKNASTAPWPMNGPTPAPAPQKPLAARHLTPGWLHTYNHHRGHTALKGLPPASRVTNLSGQNTYGSRAPGLVKRLLRSLSGRTSALMRNAMSFAAWWKMVIVQASGDVSPGRLAQ